MISKIFPPARFGIGGIAYEIVWGGRTKKKFVFCLFFSKKALQVKKNIVS
jgi:hypothetical protein